MQLVHSQNIDSLEKSLKNGKIDTNRVKTYNQLFLNYEFTDTVKAFFYLREALVLSQKLSYKPGEALVYLHTGFSKEDFGDYDNALIYYIKSKNVYASFGDEFGIANCENALANIYRSKSLFPEALASYTNALNYYLKSRNQKGIGSVYNNIGSVYDAIGNYKKATEYYIKSIGFYEKINFELGVAATYCNLGVIFQSQRNYETAISYFNKSIILCQKLGQKNFEGNNYNNLGDLYEAKGDLKTALQYHLKALKIRTEISDKFGMGSTLANIGGIYSDLDSLKQALVYLDESEKIYLELESKKFYAKTILRKATVLIKTKQFPVAEKYVKTAIDIAKEIDGNDELRRAYYIATDLYEKMGNASKALTYSKMYIAIQDSVFSIENRKTITELERKYQSEKKDAEINILNKDKVLQIKEIEQSNLIKKSLLAGVLLVLLLLGVSVKAFLTKKKSNQIITLQKNEVEKQRQLADERREIAESPKSIIEEKQKEILDSIHYAKRIQQAMLTSESYFNEYLNAEYFIFYQPKDIVSGDFYWASYVKSSVANGNKNLFYLATADCTGHGVPGAFMSLLNISFLNENIIEKEIQNPAQVLIAQRKQIIKALNPSGTENSKDGMDCVLCAFDFNDYTLEFAAANNPLWLIRNNELIEHKANKMPVGKGEDNDKDFTCKKIELQKGDMIYTFTDGYADQFGGPRGKKFMYKRLHKLLLENHQLPIQEQRELFSKTINDWKGDNEQVDDILLIGIRV